MVSRYDCAYPKDDLIQTARLELLRVAENFDSTRGVKLLTYANRFIKAAMEKEIIAQLNMTGIPSSHFRKIRRAYAVYAHGSGHTEKEKLTDVCVGMSIAYEQAVQYMAESRFTSFLRLYEIHDISVTDVWNAPLDPFMLPPEPYYIRKETIVEAIAFIRKNLTANQFDILRLHYGVGCSKEYTFDEIGKALMMKPASVRKAHNKAIDKLRDVPGGSSLL